MKISVCTLFLLLCLLTAARGSDVEVTSYVTVGALDGAWQAFGGRGEGGRFPRVTR